MFVLFFSSKHSCVSSVKLCEIYIFPQKSRKILNGICFLDNLVWLLSELNEENTSNHNFSLIETQICTLVCITIVFI